MSTRRNTALATIHRLSKGRRWPTSAPAFVIDAETPVTSTRFELNVLMGLDFGSLILQPCPFRSHESTHHDKRPRDGWVYWRASSQAPASYGAHENVAEWKTQIAQPYALGFIPQKHRGSCRTDPVNRTWLQCILPPSAAAVKPVCRVYFRHWTTTASCGSSSWGPRIQPELLDDDSFRQRPDAPTSKRAEWLEKWRVKSCRDKETAP